VLREIEPAIVLLRVAIEAMAGVIVFGQQRLDPPPLIDAPLASQQSRRAEQNARQRCQKDKVFYDLVILTTGPCGYECRQPQWTSGSSLAGSRLIIYYDKNHTLRNHKTGGRRSCFQGRAPPADHKKVQF
jgi:hypothetical protein